MPRSRAAQHTFRTMTRLQAGIDGRERADRDRPCQRVPRPAACIASGEGFATPTATGDPGEPGEGLSRVKNLLISS